MAKFGLFFLAVFLIIQFTTAARVIRDAPAPADDPSKSFEKAFDSLKKGLEDTFTKENVNKIIDNLGNMGTQLKELGQNLATKVQEKANDLNKKTD